MTLLPNPPSDFWPITGAGWIALFAAIATPVIVAIGAIVAYGKWLARMNGLGRRVKDVEDSLVQVKTVQDERGRQFERILTQHEQLIAAVSDSKKSAEQCSADAEQHALMIGSKVDELKNINSKMELSISQRLTAVETKMEILMRQSEQ